MVGGRLDDDVEAVEAQGNTRWTRSLDRDLAATQSLSRLQFNSRFETTLYGIIKILHDLDCLKNSKMHTFNYTIIANDFVWEVQETYEIPFYDMLFQADSRRTNATLSHVRLQCLRGSYGPSDFILPKVDSYRHSACRLHETLKVSIYSDCSKGPKYLGTSSGLSESWGIKSKRY